MDLLIKLLRPSKKKESNDDEFFVDLVASVKKPKKSVKLTTPAKIMMAKNLKTDNKSAKAQNQTSPAKSQRKVSTTNKTTVKTTKKAQSTTSRPSTKKNQKDSKSERFKRKKYQRRDIVIDLNNETISSLINDQLNKNYSESSLINFIMKLNKQQKYKHTATTTARSTSRKTTTVDIQTIIDEIETEQMEFDWETGSFGPVSIFTRICIWK